MKNRSPILLLLVCAQIGASVAVAALCYLQISVENEIRSQNTVLSRFQERRQATIRMIQVAEEYSKQDPGIQRKIAAIRATLQNSARPVPGGVSGAPSPSPQ